MLSYLYKKISYIKNFKLKISNAKTILLNSLVKIYIYL